MNLRKKISASACALALTLTGAIVGAPAAHAAPTGIGYGAVDVFGATVPGCVGTCNIDEGAGVVVPNVWSTNEVITVAHVVDGIAPGNPIYIYDPQTLTFHFGYVQRKDEAADLAVLWIYDRDGNGNWISAPTFAPAYVGAYNVPNGHSVQSFGDHNSNWSSPPLGFDHAEGTVVDNSHQMGPQCRSIPNEIETTFMTQRGDSGGPLYDIDGRDYPSDYYTVVGINDCSDLSAPFNHSYAIQIGWAIWDMLHIAPWL